MKVNSFQDREHVTPCQVMAKHRPSIGQVLTNLSKYKFGQAYCIQQICQAFYQVFVQVFCLVFVQVFDQVFGQAFDQVGQAFE